MGKSENRKIGWEDCRLRELESDGGIMYEEEEARQSRPAAETGARHSARGLQK